MTSSLSEVHPDALDECRIAVRDFYASVRVIYASLLAHIRAHTTELSHMSGITSTTLSTSLNPHTSSSSSANVAAASVPVTHEYRRNVYLDSISMQLMMENLDIYKERIQQLQQQQQQQSASTLSLPSIKQQSHPAASHTPQR